MAEVLIKKGLLGLTLLQDVTMFHKDLSQDHKDLCLGSWT